LDQLPVAFAFYGLLLPWCLLPSAFSSAFCLLLSAYWPYNRRMAVSGRRKSIAFFITLGACLVALAIALNVGWIFAQTLAEVALLVLG